MKGLIKIPLEPGCKPVPAKVSEVILEFAQPLMEFGEDGPPDIQTMRNIMMLAMVCWNVPIMESRMLMASCSSTGTSSWTETRYFAIASATCSEQVA